MRLPKTEGLYLYISDRLPPLSMILYQLYQRSADEDGFLYIYYTSQEDKGCCII